MRVNWFEASNAPSLLKAIQPRLQRLRPVSDQGSIESAQKLQVLPRRALGELHSLVSRLLTVLSDLNWWFAEMLSRAIVIQPQLSDENSPACLKRVANICNRVFQVIGRLRYQLLPPFPTFNGRRGMAISLDSTLRSHRPRAQSCKKSRLQGNTSLMRRCRTAPGRYLP